MSLPVCHACGADLVGSDPHGVYVNATPVPGVVDDITQRRNFHDRCYRGCRKCWVVDGHVSWCPDAGIIVPP